MGWYPVGALMVWLEMDLPSLLKVVKASLSLFYFLGFKSRGTAATVKYSSKLLVFSL